jgi:hypothetical protein
MCVLASRLSRRWSDACCSVSERCSRSPRRRTKARGATVVMMPPGPVEGVTHACTRQCHALEDLRCSPGCANRLRTGLHSPSTPEVQYDALRAAGCDAVFIDKASGKLARRPELDWAFQLDRGDQLLAADGRLVRVVGLRPGSQRVTTAYNLTVDGIHTYYVLAGSVPVPVHNCGGLTDLAFCTPWNKRRRALGCGGTVRAVV